MSAIPTPNPPEGAKVPQYDYLEALEALRQENRAIMVDGPAGDKVKRVIDKLILVLKDVL